MYQSLYNTINDLVFAGSIVPESYADLVVTLFSTLACFALVALPFIPVIMVVIYCVRR